MHNRNTVKVDIPDWYNPNTPLIQNWKAFYKKKKSERRHSKTALRMLHCLLAFQAPTQLYMFVTYFIPYFLSDYDDWTQYYVKVFVYFCCIEGLANYLCCSLYDTALRKTKDRPNDVRLHERWNYPPERFTTFDTTHQNGHVMEDRATGESLEWHYCEICQLRVPPRTHHCKTCNVCILKRDHHCYMVGRCIGFRNQRYFVVLVFYASIIGFVGGYTTVSYLRLLYAPHAYSWTDYLLPFTLVRACTGTIPLHIAIMIFHVYTEVLFGFIGFIYLNAQMIIIVSGKTLYEMTKDIPVKSTASVNSNFVSVFGNFWLLNFVFPMQMVLRQTGDGTTWDGVKFDHTAKRHQ